MEAKSSKNDCFFTLARGLFLQIELAEPLELAEGIGIPTRDNQSQARFASFNASLNR